MPEYHSEILSDITSLALASLPLRKQPAASKVMACHQSDKEESEELQQK